MRTHRHWSRIRSRQTPTKIVLLIGALILTGCGKDPEAPVKEAVDLSARLGTSIDISLKSWLALSREELARKVKEFHDTVKTQHQVLRSTPASALFLPALREPLTLPILAEATFSDQLGISIPPYYLPGTSDPELAIHLARHGDVEAALKIAGEDASLRNRIEHHRRKINYPFEWSQLAFLAQHAAQLKLAGGQIEGATELVQLHLQLEGLLDNKTAQGQLGAVLLPQGQRALTEAMTAWRDPKNLKARLADDVEAALKQWGAPHMVEPAIKPGASKESVASLLRGKPQGSILHIEEGGSLQRALDLLALPVGREGAQGVVAFLDSHSRLRELQLVYSANISETYPGPRMVAYPLLNIGLVPTHEGPQALLPHAVFSADDVTYRITLTPRSSAFGGFVRMLDASKGEMEAMLPENPLDLGIVRLDRSFEQNRLLLAPEQSGQKQITLRRKDLIGQMRLPQLDPLPGLAALEREKDQDLVGAVVVLWPNEHNLALHAFTKLAIPLWAEFGPGKIGQEDGDEQSWLVLYWDRGSARYALRLPYNRGEGPAFVVEDRRGDQAYPGRSKEAEGVDLAERKKRWAENKLITRLPRWLHFQQIELGMSRENVQRLLPQAEVIRPYSQGNGISLMLLQPAPGNVTHWPQQMIIVFGSDEKVAEIRVRYLEGPRAPGPQNLSLIDRLTQYNGAPSRIAAPWAGLWPDLPPLKPAPVCYRWIDDRTLMTYQRDSGGSEVVIRDCPVDYPNGKKVTPWQICTRGAPGCTLGMTRSEVLAGWKGNTSTATDGALILSMPPTSPYDTLVVYFADEKVARVLARHRERPKGADRNVTSALQLAWGRDVDHLGAVRRQDPANGLLLQGYGWQDDLTRVRIFGQETQEGPCLFTEWKSWPVDAPEASAGRN